MKWNVFFALLLFAFSSMVFAQSTPEIQLWSPASDDVYLQEVAQKIKTDKPIEGIGLYRNQCYVIIGKQLFELDGEKFSSVKNAPENINRIIPINDELWVLSQTGIYKINGKKWSKIDDQQFVDVCLHQGILHAATVEEVFKLEDGKFISIKPEGG